MTSARDRFKAQMAEHTRQLQLRYAKDNRPPEVILEQLDKIRRENPQRPLRRRETSGGERVRYPSRSTGREDLRRRARHAAQSLPWAFRVDYDLSDAQVLVLALHYRMADASGQWEPSVKEVSNRCAISERAATYAHRKLESLGLLSVEQRRVSSFRNDTNVYCLSPDLLKSRGSKKEGAKGCTAIGDNKSPSSTETEFSEKDGVQNTQPPPLPRKHSTLRSKPPSKKTRRSPWGATDQPSVVDLKVARYANRMLDPEQPIHATLEQIWERVDEIRSKVCPRLYPQLWDIGVQRHGFKAALAVFETALLSEVGHVEKPHGYVWGTLRKAEEECQPALTLGRLFVQRRMPAGLRGPMKKAPLREVMTRIEHGGY